MALCRRRWIPNGVYPYVSYCETSQRPAPKKYGLLVLENDRMTVTICPDLGGKVISLVHKGTGKEVLYAPDVIRHTRILPRFYFVAGGIEVSFPISHSPSQNEPVPCRVDTTDEQGVRHVRRAGAAVRDALVGGVLPRAGRCVPHRARRHPQSREAAASLDVVVECRAAVGAGHGL